MVSELPKKIKHQVRERLKVAVEHDDTKDAWRACEKKTKELTQEEHDRKHAAYVVELACKPVPQFLPYHHVYLVYGIYSNWVEERDVALQFALGPGPSDVTRLSFEPFSLMHGKTIVQGLVDEDCPVAKEMGERIIRQLNAINAYVREIMKERMMQVDSQ